MGQFIVELVLQLIARIVFTVLVVWFVEPLGPSKILATALDSLDLVASPGEHNYDMDNI